MANPNLDLGTSLNSQPAPEISLTNQFGQPMSLSQFRGKVVMLGVRGLRVHHGLPAHHAEHGAGEGTARQGG